MEDKDLSTKIEVLFSALQRPKSWYTGISIKKYLKKEIFSLQEKPDFNNPAIASKRWSCYCHYSDLKAFENLLDKNQIQAKSRVLCHPLLPAYMVEALLKRESEVISLDIDKASLSFKEENFFSFIDDLNSQNAVDLVIHYGFNGLYEPIKKMLEYTQKSAIPSIFVVDNFDLNFSLLEVFESLTLGGVLWSFGDSFWDDQLGTVLDFKLKSHPWFVSWQIETRTRSLLEYHLSESQIYFRPMAEAFYYLLLKKNPKFSFKNFLRKQVFINLLNKKNFKDPQKAITTIQTNYSKILDLAIPDFVFDLQVQSPVKFRDFGHPEDILFRSNDLQNLAKNLYNSFLAEIPKRPKSSLEIANFYLDRTYLKYVFFTTESAYWYQVLKNDYVVESFPDLHPIISQRSDLVNTKFVRDFGLIIDVESGLK